MCKIVFIRDTKSYLPQIYSRENIVSFRSCVSSLSIKMKMLPRALGRRNAFEARGKKARATETTKEYYTVRSKKEKEGASERLQSISFTSFSRVIRYTRCLPLRGANVGKCFSVLRTVGSAYLKQSSWFVDAVLKNLSHVARSFCIEFFQIGYFGYLYNRACLLVHVNATLLLSLTR